MTQQEECNEEGSIRLEDGETVFEGRVGICYNDTWGTVCSNDWEIADATVVCRQLEFSTQGTKALLVLILGAELT